MSKTVKRTFHVHPDVTINALLTGSTDTTDQTLPTIIFLHYWGGSSKTWSAVNALVSKRYPTVAIDFRGWGDSTGPEDDNSYSMANLAADVEFVIKALQLESFILVGLSMGAKVAQLLAGQGHLAGLQNIVLVSPAPPSPLVLPPEMSEQQIHAYDTLESAEFVARNVLTVTDVSDDTISALVNDMMRGNASARKAWPSYGMGENITAIAKNVLVPALIIAAEKDVVEPLDRVRKEVQCNIPGSKLTSIPDCGHLSPVEAPEELSRHILQFVGERR